MQYQDFSTLRLGSGLEITPVTVAWAQYGQPPVRARNVYLLLHGITSSPQAFLGDPAPTFDVGWFQAWAEGVFDLEHDCVLAPNALGSCFGSSSPRLGSGPTEFPQFTISDTVRFYSQWLRWLGIGEVSGVIGYSYGGYQAFQWALEPPLPTGKVIVLASGPKGNGTRADVDALWRLAARLDVGDPSAQKTWREQRINTLRRYGHADWIVETRGSADEALEKSANLWSLHFPPQALACLRHSAMQFDVQALLQARVGGVPILWMVNSGDRLFPSNDLCGAYYADVECRTVCGRFGHSSPMHEPELWMPSVRDFLLS